MLNMLFRLIIITFCIVSTSAIATTSSASAPQKHVILFIWDGLRPDAVSQETTPELYRFMKSGVEFSDNHATYPTFTMMNAASFATGDRAGNTGFYGNTLWHPGVQGMDSAGKKIDFTQPIFTEDYKILQALNQDELFFVPTLFEAAHQQHLRTAVVGKTGPAFMQDYLSEGIVFDEKHAYPLSFAKKLQADGYPLPKNSPLQFDKGKLTLRTDNGDPTAASKIYYFADAVTSNPSDQHGSPYSEANRYLMKVYLNEIVSQQRPNLAVIWMRNPDTTEHTYGPGSLNYLQALRDNDALLGELLAALKQNKLYDQTDILIVSDHAHSSVSGAFNLFPLRNIQNNRPGTIDPKGYSVSGNVRTADLLAKAGFHAYDGDGCQYTPVMSGIKADGMPLHPVRQDKTGKICGQKGELYTSVAYKVPKRGLPHDAIIVAANGGSDYFYVPSHDKNTVKKLVRFLQSYTMFDAIFVDGTRYGELDGTIPLETIGIQNAKNRSPDVIVGFSYDAEAKIHGTPGIEYADWPNVRGNHGSFSPVDVHNFLAAKGPDFREQFTDKLPTGNVDVAPTIAYILGLNFASEGRVLHEALLHSNRSDYKVDSVIFKAVHSADNIKTFNILNEALPAARYSVVVYAKMLSEDRKKYFYFDFAKALRD